MVWIGWPFRSGVLAFVLSLGTETCLAQAWLCRHPGVAVALSFAVVLTSHWCLGDFRFPPAPKFGGELFHLSSCMCGCCCWEKLSEFKCLQRLQMCRPPRRRLTRPALTQLAVRSGLPAGWSLGQREFLRCGVGQAQYSSQRAAWRGPRRCQEAEMHSSVVWEGGKVGVGV